MPKKKPTKFVPPPSSESEIDKDEDSSDSSIVTSFESRESVGHKIDYDTGTLKKKPQKIRKTESPRREIPDTPRQNSNQSPQRRGARSAGSSKDYTYSRPLVNSEYDESDPPQTNTGSSRTHTAKPIKIEGNARKRSGMKVPGTKALREIAYHQKRTNLLLAKLPFARLVKEVAMARKDGIRWQVLALEALQEAAENYLVHLFESSLLCTLHRSRVTLSVKDMQLARRIGSRYENF